MDTPKKTKPVKIKTKLDRPEPFMAIDNCGALYSILTDEEIEPAKKAGRQIVVMSPLSLRETRAAMSNLTGASLASMPAIPDVPERPKRGRR